MKSAILFGSISLIGSHLLNLLILPFFILFFLYSFNIFSYEVLTGKKYLCSDLLWGFDFLSSEKVEVIKTDINNKTNVREYYYETDSKLSYVNIYSIENEIRNFVYSIYLKTLRVDIWTMTSGGNTTREIIPSGFCKITNIEDILNHIESLKINY